MADELTLRCSLSFEKAGRLAELLIGPLKRDVAGNKPFHNVQAVGFAAEEALLLSDASVGGFLIGVNRDATNYMEIRPASGVADLIKLLPGDPCLFRITGDATPYVIADTAAVDFEYVIIPL